MNDKDEVVGFSGGNVTVAFYWTRASGFRPMQTLGGATAGAFGINESSIIAGYSATSAGPTHAVLWPDRKSAPQDLGTLPGGAESHAVGLNNSSQVVGNADVP